MPLYVDTVQTDTNHEKVLKFTHTALPDITIYIAIHNTKRGPALGGCRIWNYNSEEDALVDVLKLSRAMSFKCIMADLALGGGKMVVTADAKTAKNNDLYQFIGEALNYCSGEYISGEDVGVDSSDVDQIKKYTPFMGGSSNGSGDPSKMTAIGVLAGIVETWEHISPSVDISHATISIQGLGHVGSKLLDLLYLNGCKLVVTDIDNDILSTISNYYSEIKVVEQDAIFSEKVDIFSPCALGGILTKKNLSLLNINCHAIAGAANNQLADGVSIPNTIKYAVDYVINAGGLINISGEVLDDKYDEKKIATQTVKTIRDNLEFIYYLSNKLNVSEPQVAAILAEERLSQN